MSREVRRVPAGWEHPKNASGHFVALLGRAFTQALAEWTEAKEKWDAGLRSDFDGGWTAREGNQLMMSFEEWTGKKPIAEDYMPEWPAERCTMLVMYETTSEGTPISPPFATPEELAHWLADSGASAFGSMTATYEQWFATCKEGWAPSAILDKDGLHSGVATSGKP